MNISSDMAEFKLLVQEIVEADSIFIDVWELKLSVDEVSNYIISKNHGAIVQIVGDHGEKQMKKDESTNKNITEYRRSFINYFSLGYDARVGFGKISIFIRFR